MGYTAKYRKECPAKDGLTVSWESGGGEQVGSIVSMTTHFAPPALIVLLSNTRLLQTCHPRLPCLLEKWCQGLYSRDLLDCQELRLLASVPMELIPWPLRLRLQTSRGRLLRLLIGTT